MIYRWIEPEARAERVAVHAIAVDDYGLIDHWSAEQDGAIHWLGCHNQRWELTVGGAGPLCLVLRGEPEGGTWRLKEESEGFRCIKDKEASAS